jgi:hypothetical protein
MCMSEYKPGQSVNAAYKCAMNIVEIFMASEHVIRHSSGPPTFQQIAIGLPFTIVSSQYCLL